MDLFRYRKTGSEGSTGATRAAASGRPPIRDRQSLTRRLFQVSCSSAARWQNVQPPQLLAKFGQLGGSTRCGEKVDIETAFPTAYDFVTFKIRTTPRSPGSMPRQKTTSPSSRPMPLPSSAIESISNSYSSFFSIPFLSLFTRHFSAIRP